MLETFVRFCQTPGQRLVCVREFDDEDQELVVPIQHQLNPGADAQTVALLRKLLREAAPAFAAVYARFDGAQLFVDQEADEPLIAIAPVDQWTGLAARYQEILEELEMFYDQSDLEPDLPLFGDDQNLGDDPFGTDDDEPGDAEPDDEDGEAMPEWLDSAVPFAEMVQSGSLFVVATEGPVCGNIYFLDLDLGEPELFATSLQEFLARITYCDPARLLQHLQAEFEFGQGNEADYWLPQRYLIEGR